MLRDKGGPLFWPLINIFSWPDWSRARLGFMQSFDDEGNDVA